MEKETETSQWVEQHNFAASIVIILGLGEGRHVREWLEAHPNSHAVVIDTRADSMESFKQAHPELSDRFDLLAIDSLDALMKHEILSFVAESLPPVLMFRPAFGEAKSLFDSFFATLTGRNIWGVRFFLSKYGFESAEAVEIGAEGRLLTIKDLGVVIDTASSGHPRAGAVRILKELIV